MKAIIAFLAGLCCAPLFAIVHDISYASARGGKVPAFLVTPARSGRAPAVVFVHWGLGDRHAFLDEARSLARLGVVSLLIDSPGARPGPRVSEADDLTGCVADVRRGIDLLAKRPDVDAKRIAFVGLSFGAHVGAMLVPSEPRLRAFVLAGGLASNGDAELAPLDAERFVKEPHSAPIFFQFARNDEYIDYAQAARFIEAASQPRVAKWYEGGHEFNLSSRRDRISWLASLLGFPLPDENYFAVATTEAPATELGRYAELSKFGVVIDVPGMLQIPIKRDVAFKSGMKMDIYYPLGMEPQLAVPAIILVSGQAGAPLMKNLRGVAFNTSMARALAARANRIAIVCDIAPTYTSMTDPGQENARLMDVAADLDDLIAYLRAHSVELQIDAGSLAIFTRSAGWSYGLRAAFRNPIKAVVAYSARLTAAPLRGTGIADDLLPQFSATDQLSAHFPPFLLVTAEHDDFYVPAEVDTFLAKAKERSVVVEHIHVGGEHSFECVNDYEESRDALRRTFTFLREHLPLRR